MEKEDLEVIRMVRGNPRRSEILKDMKAQAVEMTEQIEASAKSQSVFGDAVKSTGKGFDALLSRASRLVCLGERRRLGQHGGDDSGRGHCRWGTVYGVW